MATERKKRGEDRRERERRERERKKERERFFCRRQVGEPHKGCSKEQDPYDLYNIGTVKELNHKLTLLMYVYVLNV